MYMYLCLVDGDPSVEYQLHYPVTPVRLNPRDGLYLSKPGLPVGYPSIWYAIQRFSQYENPLRERGRL
jgi:hypothetical protein